MPSTLQQLGDSSLQWRPLRAGGKAPFEDLPACPQVNKVCSISMRVRKPEVSPRDVLFLESQMSLAQSPAPRTGATSSPVLAGTS